MSQASISAKLPRIASVTLAQLYLQQNHLEQAKKIVDHLLAENPFHGPALVLQHRLESTASPLLTAYPHGNAVRIHWLRVPIEKFPQQLQIIVIVFAKRASKSMYVTSVPCATSQGECFLACGKQPGAASICIAELQNTSNFLSSSSLAFFRPIAVCQPVAWP